MKYIWTIIGALAAVTSIAVTLYIHFSQEKKEKKAIEIEEKYKSELVSTYKKISDKLQIMYDGEIIKNYIIIGLTIRNSGAVPIEPNDYVEPLAIHLSGTKKIVNVEIKNTDPKDLLIDINVTGSVITFEKELLNPTDGYSIEVGVIPIEGEEVEVEKIYGRISGIKDIQYKKHERIFPGTPWTLQLTYIVLLVQLYLFFFLSILLVIRKIPYFKSSLPTWLTGKHKRKTF